MQNTLHQWRQWVGSLLVMLTCCGLTHAAYPEKPVRIVVGFPAGTTADLLARAIAKNLSDQLGQAFVIDNKPGAGSSIAAEMVAKSPPDGYTLLLSTTANFINPSLSNSLKFDFTKDLAPISLLAENPVVLIAPSNSPNRTVADVVNAAKLAPNRMTFASSGNGTFTHLYGELLNQSSNIKITHVPYKGSSQAMTDVIAGNVDLSFTPVTPVMSSIKAGKLTAIAMVARKRMASLADVPTFAEAGIAGFDAALWFGLNAPTGTPAAVIERLTLETQKSLSLPDTKAHLQNQGIEVIATNSSSFADLINRELARWSKVVKNADIKSE